MEELRECPGCGGTRVATELWGDWFITECQECRQWQTGFHSNENDSKKSWNIRTSDAAIKELVEALSEIVDDAKGYESRSGKTVSWREKAEAILSKHNGVVKVK